MHFQLKNNPLGNTLLKNLQEWMLENEGVNISYEAEGYRDIITEINTKDSPITNNKESSIGTVHEIQSEADPIIDFIKATEFVMMSQEPVIYSLGPQVNMYSIIKKMKVGGNYINTTNIDLNMILMCIKN